jgi:hypothetical protein
LAVYPAATTSAGIFAVEVVVDVVAAGCVAAATVVVVSGDVTGVVAAVEVTGAVAVDVLLLVLEATTVDVVGVVTGAVAVVVVPPIRFRRNRSASTVRTVDAALSVESSAALTDNALAALALSEPWLPPQPLNMKTPMTKGQM